MVGDASCGDDFVYDTSVDNASVDIHVTCEIHKFISHNNINFRDMVLD